MQVKKQIIKSATLAFVMLLALPSLAATYSFSKITNNGSTDVASQLVMDVTQSGAGALFTFYNNVGIASSITDIYFDQGNSNLFSSIVMFNDSGLGVSFDSSASPANLPSGNTIGFTSDFSGDSNSPVMSKGVNVLGEWVSFMGTLGSGMSFEGLLASLANGEFRVGLHVQSILNGYSDSFVNNPPAHTPLPGAVWLLGSALAGFGVVTKRRKAQRNS